MRKPTGYLLYEDSDIAVIATTQSRNRKTANMVQVWILCRNVTPIDAVKTGADRAICLDCPSRGVNGKQRKCYVQLRAPQSIWRAYQRGSYPRLSAERYASVFGGRKVRFGAYGEPVLIPIAVLAELAHRSAGWTGYTHQWRKPEYAAYRPYLMASCDSQQDALDAIAAGWRYFRVGFAGLMPGEISCPASEEAGKRTTCKRCGLCDGAKPNDARKNIAIRPHGSGAKHFIRIAEIRPAMARV